MKPLSRALGHLKKYWLVALGAYLSLLVVTAGNLVTPRLIQVIIDQGITGKNLSVILWMALGLVALALGRSLFQFAQGYLSERASQGVAYDLRNALYAKIQSLSFSYHDQAQTGQLLTRATNDVELVRMFTGMGFLQFLNSVVMLVGSLILLFAMNWRLALVAVVILPLVLGLFSVFGLKARPMFSRVQKKLAALNIILQENLAGVRVVKAFAREPFEAERFGKGNRELLDEFLKVGRLMACLFPTLFLVFNLSTLAINWYGGFQVIGGDLTVGQLVAFNAYLMMVMMPVGILGMIATMISRAAASAERIFEILDAQSEVADAPDAQPLPSIEGRVTFEDVRFRYFARGERRRTTSSKEGEWVLDGVSFAAEPGQTVALLGATGSGKSTIINLIPRFYDVSEGRITVDGHDVRDVTIESLRSQIGIVLQEATLFTGTVRDNIAFGKPEATMEEIIAAAKAAEAHEFIVGFPDGYDTEVGERGVTLSGGQKQRIAIARALLLDPRILILDDSTSSVDFSTEERIQQALDELMKGRTSPSAPLRTSFVIAQRISTVLNADQILVLDKGRIVARGTHEELMESSPIYAEIYYSQLHGEFEARAKSTRNSAMCTRRTP
ncbi:MAG: ABC transporter ATP-binding protein [Anaerolineales bacterium]|nr:MAG: ABC transporter ATP-binding protein [Anaerolineales bacterium]